MKNPASGAKLKLWVKWKDAKGESASFTSDENGYFRMPEMRAAYKETAIAQIVITQEITVEYNNEVYLIWTLSKTNTHMFGELGRKPINLTCEISKGLEPIRTDEILMATTCHWE
jgi:hypothetical protein